MNVRIDDDLLERLVSYEVHVNRHFSQVAQSRWLNLDVDTEQSYKKLKELKSHISSLVDLAFRRYGVEKGLMKADQESFASDLDDDLESLAGELNKASWKAFSSLKDKNIALVV